LLAPAPLEPVLTLPAVAMLSCHIFTLLCAMPISSLLAEGWLRNETEHTSGTGTGTTDIPQPLAPGQETDVVVRILHISDTHNLHLSAEEHFPFPEADILIHTGDVSDLGTAEEFVSVNAWFGELKRRYKHILLVTGNHDWLDALKKVHSHALTAKDILKPGFLAEKLSNARVLENEVVEVMGLRIYGSSWMPWYSMQHPGDPPVGMEGPWDHDRNDIFNAWQASQPSAGDPFLSLLCETTRSRQTSSSVPLSPQTSIPSGVDILMTHHPARYILDECEKSWWGSGWELRKVIEATKPKVHLFGHVHEQRGHWERSGDVYMGGAEYSPTLGMKPFRPKPPPPAEYPVQFVANNAMKNNAWVDKIMTGQWGGSRIAGPALLITATRRGGEWTFTKSL